MIGAAAVAAALLAAAVALNLWVDPYGVFRPMVVRGRARRRPFMIQRDRLHAAFRLRRRRPRCLVLGTSDVLSGIDLGHPWLVEFPAGEKLIVGLQAAPMSELEVYLRAVAAQGALQRVILGLDIVSFSACNRPRFFMDHALIAPDALAAARARAWAWTIYETLLRPRTLRRSLQTLAARGGTPAGADVRLTYQDDGGGTYAAQDAGGALRALLSTHVRKDWLYGALQLSEAQLGAFARVVALCRAGGIELHVYLHPCHASMWAALEALGHAPLLAPFVRRVVETAGAVWAPSGFGASCAEAVPAHGPMVGYADCVHLTERTGRALFDGLAGGDSGGLELRRLEPAGVDAYLEEEARRRAAYCRGPGAWVKDLVAGIRAAGSRALAESASVA